jgi:hypothetical protein
MRLATILLIGAMASSGLQVGLGWADSPVETAQIPSVIPAPEPPVLQLTGRWFDGPVFAAAVAGNHVFFGSGGTIRVLEIGEGKTWKEIASVTTPGVIRGLVVSGDHLFASDEGGALRVFDISDPKKLHQIGFSELPKNTRAVFVQGDYAYLAAGWKGLAVVNISNPARPRVLSFTKTPGIAFDVSVVGSIALVAANEQGFRMFDVSNPMKPQMVGNYEIAGYT